MIIATRAASRLVCLFILSLVQYVGAADAKAGVKVLTSIKPVHSLVASVMEGVGTPSLLVGGAGSPHGYSLKPSHAVKIEGAQIIFWISRDFETFLEKPIRTIGASAKSVELLDSAGIAKLGFRADVRFEAEHSDSQSDPHIWLDPQNAAALVNQISATLIEADPSNGDRYRANTENTLVRLTTVSTEIKSLLEPVRDKKFIVFHDAYRYFENRFGISAKGAITINPDNKPGAARVQAIQARLKESGAVCVFAEPQFEAKIISVVTEGTGAKSKILDPLGTNLDNGPDLYFDLIRNIAISMRDCLS